MTIPAEATRFDRALRDRCVRGRTEAVFAHAASVATDAGFLTLVDESRPLVPNGIACRLDEMRLAVGGTVSLRDGWVDVQGAPAIHLSGEGVSLSVDRAGVSLSALQAQCAQLRLPQRTRVLLLGQGGEDKADRRVVARVGAALRDLVALLLSGEPTSPPNPLAASGEGASPGNAIHRLVGLGPGTTPTGDDVLVGLAAMAYRLKGSSLVVSHRLDELLGALAEVPESATTPLAREMLSHAAVGSFVEPLRCLVSVLGDPQANVKVAQDAVNALGQVGAQTGTDMLAGAVGLALAVCSSPGGQA